MEEEDNSNLQINLNMFQILFVDLCLRLFTLILLIFFLCYFYKHDVVPVLH